MLRRKAEVFAPTDGVLWLCEESGERLSRGFDWSGAAGLVRGVCLPYRSMMLRSDDVALAANDGQEVTAKVSVREPPGLSTTALVEMRGKAFDLTRYDCEGRIAYLYLTEVATDGTATIVGQTTSYDELGQAVRETEETEVTVKECRMDVEGGRPVLTVTLRTVDYAGEATVVRGGERYHVDAVATDGGWTTLKCESTAHDGEVGSP